MEQRIWHTIKGKGSSSIKFILKSQKMNLNSLQKINDLFDEGYNSDG